MSIQDLFDSCDNYCEPVDTCYLNWSLKGYGFGQLYFYTDENGVLRCENECMSKEKVKEILNIMVDNSIFND